jgi:DNA-binding winged helix-turn-helix (wHTH) protein
VTNPSPGNGGSEDFGAAEPAYCFGDFRLMTMRRRLMQGDEAIALGPRALSVLIHLVERHDRIVTKEELLSEVWPGTFVEEHNLVVQVSALRKVLGQDAISTIPGRGYKFTAAVVRHEGSVPAVPETATPDRSGGPHSLAPASIVVGPARIESRRPSRGARHSWPGLWPCFGIASLSGILCWVMLTATLPAGAETGPEAQLSELAPVEDRDIGAALATMAGSPAFLARFRSDAIACPLPLAVVSVARAAGQPPGLIRLRSGSYFSPLFNLAEVPVRVAIPYPSPYQTGHGKLAVLGAASGAIVGLTPPWRVPATSSEATHEVIWKRVRSCETTPG